MTRGVDELPHWDVAAELRARRLGNVGWALRRHLYRFDDVRILDTLFPQRNVRRETVAALVGELDGRADLVRSLASASALRWADGTPVVRQEPEAELKARLAGVGRARVLFLYVAVRLLQPALVVETGCFTGWDSAIVLCALDRNGNGHLFTIDLPAEEGKFSQLGPQSSLPAGAAPGFLIPAGLRSSWTLLIGNTREELAPLLGRLHHIDMFYRDSHHAYSQMMWEYTTVWPHLRDGGLMVSDDIAWNTAFRDFAHGVGSRLVVHRSSRNFGALVKEGSQT